MLREPRESLWTPHVIMLLAVGHLYFITFYALIVTFPRFLDNHSDIVIGIVIGTFGLGAFAIRLWAGALSDAVGRRTILLTASAGCGLMLVLYAQGDFPPGLIPVRLIHGVLWVTVLTSWTTLCVDFAPEARRAEVLAGTLMSTHSASLYAPALGLLIASQLGYRVLFIVLATFFFIATGVASLVPEKNFQRQEIKFSRRIPFSRPTLLPMLGFLGATIPFGVVQGFLALRVEGHASPQFFFLTFGVCVIGISMLAGRMAARIGLSSTAAIGLLAISASMVLTAIAADELPMIFAGALFATGFGAAYTGFTTLAGGAVAQEERGLAIATVTMAFDFGTAAPFVLGVLSDVGGLKSVFVFGAGIAVLSLGPLFAYRPERLREEHVAEASAG